MGQFDTGLDRLRHSGGICGELVFANKETTRVLRDFGGWHYRKLCGTRRICVLLKTPTFSPDESDGLCHRYSCVYHSADTLLGISDYYAKTGKEQIDLLEKVPLRDRLKDFAKNVRIDCVKTVNDCPTKRRRGRISRALSNISRKP